MITMVKSLSLGCTRMMTLMLYMNCALVLRVIYFSIFNNINLNLHFQDCFVNL